MTNLFSQQNIKPYKGKLVKVSFGENEITGIIRSNNRRFIIFDVNKTGFEIKINYSAIENLEIIKSKKRKIK